MALHLLRWFRSRDDADPAARAGGGEQSFEALLADIRQLNDQERAGLARGLNILWDAFVGRFGGLDGLLRADVVDRTAYLAELQSAADEMRKSEALMRSRYALSPHVMALYLQTLSRGHTSAVAREFGQLVATLIDQGRKLRAFKGVRS
jgi:hypothetical protein